MLLQNFGNKDPTYFSYKSIFSHEIDRVYMSTPKNPKLYFTSHTVCYKRPRDASPGLETPPDKISKIQ